jgi:hypothetical protein
MRVLRLMEAAEFMPWSSDEARTWIDRFPRLAKENLPADEATAMVEMFEQEISRLQKVRIAERR